MGRNVIQLYDGWEFAFVPGLDASKDFSDRKLMFRMVTVPHDWAIERPFNRNMEQGEAQGFFDRWGIGWYRRKLEVHPKTGMGYELSFDGIYENSTVWLNNIEVGGRQYGYSSFSADITEYLKEGDNDLLIRVDNTAVPADRWYSGAGIYRKVCLIERPKVHIDPFEVKTCCKLDRDTAELKISVGGIEKKTKVRAALADKEKTLSAEGWSDEEICIEAAGIKRWSAETPYLYDLTITLLNDAGSADDEISMKYGFRSIELSPDTGLKVNSETVKLKGVCLHQDGGSFGTAVSKEIWRGRLNELKKIGCNAVRFAHHLFMPEILDLCDELGFYVYEECFDKWTDGAYGRYYETQWEKDLLCMVKRDRNRPCILFWGVGNEVANQAYDSMLRYLSQHVAAVKQADDSRFVTLAMMPIFSYPGYDIDMTKILDVQKYVDSMKHGEIFDIDERIERIKLISKYVDLLACNYHNQWYRRIHELIPDKAILGTETYMYFNGYEAAYQNYSENNPWNDAADNDYVIGGMIWTGIDYLGESMGYPAKGWSGALFSTDMEKRSIAYIMESFWSDKPMVHFAVMDGTLPDEGVKEHWDAPRYVSHWEFPQYSLNVIPYMIATNCESVELRVRDKSYTVPAPDGNGIITGYIPYLPGKVTVVGKNGGIEVCRQELTTPGMAVKLKFEHEEQTIEREDGALNESYQMLVKVRAYDTEDNPVFRESAEVHFTVQGPAEIVGVDNGDIKSNEPRVNDSIHLFRGHASAALKITGPGRVKVTAFAGGMEYAQTVIIS